MTLTGRLMTAGCDQFSPLCPGSRTITLPASGRLGAVALADGVPAGERVEPPCGGVVAPWLAAVAPPGADVASDAGVAPPDADTDATEQAASGPTSAAA